MFFLCPLLPVFDHLPVIDSIEAGFLDSRDMDKHIFSATLRLNEPIALLVELNHFTVPRAIVDLRY